MGGELSAPSSARASSSPCFARGERGEAGSASAAFAAAAAVDVSLSCCETRSLPRYVPQQHRPYVVAAAAAAAAAPLAEAPPQDPDLGVDLLHLVVQRERQLDQFDRL